MCLSQRLVQVREALTSPSLTPREAACAEGVLGCRARCRAGPVGRLEQEVPGQRLPHVAVQHLQYSRPSCGSSGLASHQAKQGARCSSLLVVLVSW